MIKIHEKLKSGFKSRMILQVHDELLFEAHEDELEEVIGGQFEQTTNFNCGC